MALGAAGGSFAMTGGASATAPTSVALQDNARGIFLGEEEIADVSLATFHVFEKRPSSRLRQGIRVAAGHGGVAAVVMAVAAVGVGALTWVARLRSCRRLRLRSCWWLRLRPCRWLRLQRLRWRLWLGRRLVRNYVLGLCRLHWKLLAMGPVPGSLDQRLLLGTRPRAAAVHTRSAEHEPGLLAGADVRRFAIRSGRVGQPLMIGVGW